MTQASPPYTIDPDVYAPFDARNTVFGRRTWDREAAFYGRDMHARAIDLIAQGKAGYSRAEFSRMRAAWTVASHFHGAYDWGRLGEPDAVLTGLGVHLVDDRAHMSAQIKETARM